jgi:hypothetical protein
MLMWRGYGILVVVLTVIGYAVGKLGAEKIWGVPIPAAYRPGSELFGMLLAAVMVYGLHLAIEAKNKSRVLVDRETGQEIVFKKKHDLFFIPIKFWSFAIALLGVVFYFQRA